MPLIRTPKEYYLEKTMQTQKRLLFLTAGMSTWHTSPRTQQQHDCCISKFNHLSQGQDIKDGKNTTSHKKLVASFQIARAAASSSVNTSVSAWPAKHRVLIGLSLTTQDSISSWSPWLNWCQQPCETPPAQALPTSVWSSVFQGWSFHRAWISQFKTNRFLCQGFRAILSGGGIRNTYYKSFGHSHTTTPMNELRKMYSTRSYKDS